MSSGFGFSGGTSRCFNEWQIFLECYTNAETSRPSDCALYADDYLECLHHSKEKAKVSKIKAEYLKKLREGSIEELTIKKNSIPEALNLIEKK
ncbi:hypothetical protein WICMUC_003471 [Wickerhamomyces mucosus]|uniref:NADH dehydrogenase [ubiquinone] iron-sulfur protein 5 n=1 Tax=Wickerhamomyces mucosus TaxID=1378264 RepID=A0A9P8PMQ0_9ASCO|nr:hypothetical protein WICMUC_003471 [Wickerhamomyces mucosus]